MTEKLIPLEDAQSIVLSHVAPTDLVESPVWQATGLPLAEDAVADIDISPFAHSAMDGFAVRAAELVEAAKSAALKARFTESRATLQGGTITYVFRME